MMTGRTRVNDRLYEHIVIGKGLMGSAAARHLSAMGAQVALIGPDEPADRWTHQGVFASWLACETGRLSRARDDDRLRVAQSDVGARAAAVLSRPLRAVSKGAVRGLANLRTKPGHGETPLPAQSSVFQSYNWICEVRHGGKNYGGLVRAAVSNGGVNASCIKSVSWSLKSLAMWQAPYTA